MVCTEKHRPYNNQPTTRIDGIVIIEGVNNMCASYWNLDAKIKCPLCGKTTLWNLQTHFMGYLGSCEHYYKLNEDIHELKGVSVILDGRIDDFNGDCEKCGRFFDMGAEIVDGKVKRVWILKEMIPIKL